MKYTTKIIKGKGRGKLLGFPTFNLDIPAGLDIKPGIYAACVWLGKDKYKGAMHYGPVPVFGQDDYSLEIFLLNYQDDKPISQLTFEPVKYLRPVKSFSTPKELTDQIRMDVIQIEQY